MDNIVRRSGIIDIVFSGVYSAQAGNYFSGGYYKYTLGDMVVALAAAYEGITTLSDNVYDGRGYLVASFALGVSGVEKIITGAYEQTPELLAVGVSDIIIASYSLGIFAFRRLSRRSQLEQCKNQAHIRN